MAHRDRIGYSTQARCQRYAQAVNGNAEECGPVQLFDGSWGFVEWTGGNGLEVDARLYIRGGWFIEGVERVKRMLGDPGRLEDPDRQLR